MGVFDTVASIGKPNLHEDDKPVSDVVFENQHIAPSIQEALHLVSLDERRKAVMPTLMNAEDRVTEVWFAGAHSDVGGGYSDASLADVALLWMAERAVECGLAVDLDGLRQAARPAGGGRLHDSRRGIFRLLPSGVRAIGGRSAESVHESVLRRRADPSQRYAPLNLEAYLASRAGG